MNKPIKVPTSIKIFGYFFLFNSIFVSPIAILWIIGLTKGTERIIIGIILVLSSIFNFLMSFGMVKGNIRAIKVFYYLNKFDLFFHFLNPRIEEYLDEVENKKYFYSVKTW